MDSNICRYNAALLGDTFTDIDPIEAQQALDNFHKLENSVDGCDSWFEASCAGNTNYWECEGDQTLTWKDKGYVTVFDLLTVCKFEHYAIKIFVQKKNAELKRSLI